MTPLRQQSMARDHFVVLGWLALLLALWLGFTVHESPRFAGSLWGGVLGIAAATLMLVPLGYVLVKRIAWLRGPLTRHVPLSRLLAWHVYAGIGGAMLGVVHAGHRYDSWIGTALTTAMFAAILTGYVGRYFLRFVGEDLTERRRNLLVLQADFGELATQVASGAMPPDAVRARVLRTAEALAEAEHAIAADELLRRRLRQWLLLHIASSIAFYVLLAMHVWSALQFGLRWFS